MRMGLLAPDRLVVQVSVLAELGAVDREKINWLQRTSGHWKQLLWRLANSLARHGRSPGVLLRNPLSIRTSVVVHC